MTYIPKGGTTSTNNSTTSTLAGDATYTGTGEQNNLPQVGVYSFADAAGTLYMDWSVDGSNWHQFPTAGFACAANIPEFHTAVKLGRYFRVRYVNGSSAQSTFRLSTYFGDNFLPSNTPMNQSIGVDNDAVVSRIGNDHALDISRGFIGGQVGVGKFGVNPDVAASATEDVIFQGTINWLTEPTTVRIKAGGDTDDHASRSGARSIIVQGLDSNWDTAEDTLATNGDSVSAASSIAFVRLNRAFVGDVGTYTGANDSHVTIENSGGGTDLLTIEGGVGHTQSSAFTVPDNKTGYLTRLRVGSTSAKASDISFWQRQNADDTATPYTSKRLVRRFLGVTGSRTVPFSTYPPFPARTDLWASVTTGSGAAGAVEVAYDLILVDC